MKRIFLITFTCIFFSFTSDDSKSEYNVPLAAYSITAGDIDLDGDNDIVVGHNYNWQTLWSGLSLLENIENGSFSLHDSIYVYGGQSNVYTQQINNDTLPDLIGQYFDGNKNNIAILKNENNNYVQTYFQMGEDISAYNTGKINDDDYRDVVFISNSGQFWGIIYNDGTGNFSSPQYYSVQDYYPSDIACADLNGDGREDIVIGGKTEIFFSYESSFQSYFLDVISGQIKLIDFDLDGDIDIISARQVLPTNYFTITMIENQGNEVFLVHDPFYFQPVCHFNFTTSDFNNDSLPDLLFHPISDENLLIFYNKGNFDIGDSVFIPMADYGETTRQSACADFDGNGFEDIATIRYLHSPIINLNILFNDGNGNFIENPVTNIQDSNFELHTSILTCYPNPFTTKTTIVTTINNNENIKLEIYDLKGNLIKTFIDKKTMSGVHKYVWKGKALTGKEVKPGIYLVRLQSGRNVNTQRVVFVK